MEIEILLGGKVILCKFDPALYITHRLACITDIMKQYVFGKVPEELELLDEWVRVVRSEDVNEIEAFIGRLEKVTGITILTIPRIHADP